MRTPKLCGSPRQSEKIRTCHSVLGCILTHPVCVEPEHLGVAAKGVQNVRKIHSPLSRELETANPSFIELCLCTGRCIRPRKYIISNPHRDVTRCVISLFTDNKSRLKKVKSFGRDYTARSSGLRIQTRVCLMPESMFFKILRDDIIFVFNNQMALSECVCVLEWREVIIFC